MQARCPLRLFTCSTQSCWGEVCARFNPPIPSDQPLVVVSLERFSRVTKACLATPPQSLPAGVPASVCDDYFGSAETDAGASEDEDGDEPADVLADVDYSAIKALASVTYDDGDVDRSSSILYIAE